MVIFLVGALIKMSESLYLMRYKTVNQGFFSERGNGIGGASGYKEKIEDLQFGGRKVKPEIIAIIKMGEEYTMKRLLWEYGEE